MNLFDVVDELCEALDAGHTGCEIEVTDNDVRVLRTFSFACATDFLITDVLRAVASPDWRRALAAAWEARVERIEASEAKRRLEEGKKGVRVRGVPLSRQRLST